LNGVPGGIRTPNLLIRSQKLYPVELQALFTIHDSRFTIHDSRITIEKKGWPTGLEPATARTTIWGSTIELWPPCAGL
jgi:hypothetical protein